MNTDELARRAMIRLSPDYAQRRIDELEWMWFEDMMHRPDDYAALIETAAPKARIYLREMLDCLIAGTKAATEDQFKNVAAMWDAAANRANQFKGDWLHIFMDEFFRPGSPQDIEYTQCINAAPQPDKT